MRYATLFLTALLARGQNAAFEGLEEDAIWARYQQLVVAPLEDNSPDDESAATDPPPAPAEKKSIQDYCDTSEEGTCVIRGLTLAFDEGQTRKVEASNLVRFSGGNFTCTPENGDPCDLLFQTEALKMIFESTHVRAR